MGEYNVDNTYPIEGYYDIRYTDESGNLIEIQQSKYNDGSMKMENYRVNGTDNSIWYYAGSDRKVGFIELKGEGLYVHYNQDGTCDYRDGSLETCNALKDRALEIMSPVNNF